MITSPICEFFAVYRTGHYHYYTMVSFPSSITVVPYTLLVKGAIRPPAFMGWSWVATFTHLVFLPTTYQTTTVVAISVNTISQEIGETTRQGSRCPEDVRAAGISYPCGKK